jgi:hypothetical protein
MVRTPWQAMLFLAVVLGLVGLRLMMVNRLTEHAMSSLHGAEIPGVARIWFVTDGPGDDPTSEVDPPRRRERYHPGAYAGAEEPPLPPLPLGGLLLTSVCFVAAVGFTGLALRDWRALPSADDG